MQEINKTYIQIMIDTLIKKIEVLQEIERITLRQSEILSDFNFDEEEFEKTLEKKGIRLRELQRLDQGFEDMYERARTSLAQESGTQYEQGRLLQERIHTCMDLGVRIEAAERRNRQRFEQSMLYKRQGIGQFHAKNQAANLYYSHMANQHMNGASYFMDKKK